MELDQLITYANGPLRWLIAAMSGSSALAFHYCGYWKILSNNSINFSSPNNSKKRIPPGFFYHLLGFFFLIVFLLDSCCLYGLGVIAKLLCQHKAKCN